MNDVCKFFLFRTNTICCHLAYPVVHVAARWMDTRFSTHKGFLIQWLYLQKASGQGVRTHPPMVLLAMVREEDIWGSWLFTRYQEVTQRGRARVLLRVKTYIYSFKGTVPLINGEEMFYVVMMTLSSSRDIITLRAAVRNHGRWRDCQRSW